jgi:hypothetical protein
LGFKVPSTAILTDGSATVVELANRNVDLNSKLLSARSAGCSSSNSSSSNTPRVTASVWNWKSETGNVPGAGAAVFDVILGADIVYPPREAEDESECSSQGDGETEFQTECSAHGPRDQEKLEACGESEESEAKVVMSVGELEEQTEELQETTDEIHESLKSEATTPESESQKYESPESKSPITKSPESVSPQTSLRLPQQNQLTQISALFSALSRLLRPGSGEAFLSLQRRVGGAEGGFEGGSDNSNSNTNSNTNSISDANTDGNSIPKSSSSVNPVLAELAARHGLVMEHQLRGREWCVSGSFELWHLRNAGVGE